MKYFFGEKEIKVRITGADQSRIDMLKKSVPGVDTDEDALLYVLRGEVPNPILGIYPAVNIQEAVFEVKPIPPGPAPKAGLRVYGKSLIGALGGKKGSFGRGGGGTGSTGGP